MFSLLLRIDHTSELLLHQLESRLIAALAAFAILVARCYRNFLS